MTESMVHDATVGAEHSFSWRKAWVLTVSPPARRLGRPDIRVSLADTRYYRPCQS